jgi:eukaryotic-like serine/threonine-protein kinase
MVDRIGQQLGNYRMVSLLGQGSYAEVYLGQHVRFKQQAAIKVLHAHLSEQETEHFQQEAETIATLHILASSASLTSTCRTASPFW